MVLQIISWYKFFERRIDGLAKTSKLQLQTRPTITAIALCSAFSRRGWQVARMGGAARARAEISRRACLVATWAPLLQKWPPPPRNVADSCELTFIARLVGVENERSWPHPRRRLCPPFACQLLTLVVYRHTYMCRYVYMYAYECIHVFM